MRNVLLVILLLAVAFCAYKAYTSGTLQKKTNAEVGGVVRDVVRSGRDVGRNTGEIFRSVGFGGK